MVLERGCYYVRAPLAQSSDDEHLTFVDVGLSPKLDQLLLEGREPFSFHEFGYEVTRVGQYDGRVDSTMDRDIAARWLPPNFGKVVLEVVAACCRILIPIVDPNYIYRITFVSLPPANYMPKHDYVTSVIENLGYSVLTNGTDPVMRKFWLMGKDGIDLPPTVDEDDGWTRSAL